MSFWQTILLFLVGSWALGMVLIAAGAFVWVYRLKKKHLPPASGPTRLSSSGPEPTLDKVSDPPRSFSGRTRELLRLVEHFEGVVMIRDSGGVPGVGKTSLARALAKQLARRFPDGSLEIDLRGHYKPLALSPAEAMRRLLWSLDLALELPDVESDLAALYHQTLQETSLMLVLDNAADAEHARPLLPSAPSGAVVTLCQGAPTGDPNLKVMRLSGLPAEESLRLLRSSSENLKQAPQAELYALARQCGNIPLALLIAGTLLKNNPSWTPSRLADRVQRERIRLGFTPGSKGGGYELEALLNITADSLGDLLESRLHMLGVLEGPFTMTAAAYIWSSDKNAAQRDMLKLQSYQLLEWSDSARSYTIHPGVQSYIFSRLLDKGNVASLAVFRHAVYYLKQVQLVLSGRQPERPLTHAEKQKLLDLLPQWRAAWKRMSGQDLPRLPVSERDAWLSSVPDACGEALVAILSEPEWRGVFDASLEAARRMEDQPREAKILLQLSRIYHERLEHEWAEMYALQALVLFQQLEDSDGEAETLTRIGLLHQEQGDSGKARDFFARALQVEASQGLKDRAVLALEQLGELASPALD